MPRKTRKVYIQSDPPIAPSTISTAFTLHCELETKNNVITDGDWTFEIGSNGNPNIVRIPFEEGIRHPFFDKDNLREQRWKKYVLPTIQAFAGPVTAAAITGGASMAVAAMGTPTSTTTIQTVAGAAITGGATIAGAVITGGTTMAAAKLGTSNAQTMNVGTGN